MILARQNKARIAISQWVINESVAAVQRKKNEGKITDRQASEILTGIADTIEGKLENINLSLYPISEKEITDSRITIYETKCPHAPDALHIYVADKANCIHFVTADEQLADVLKKSPLKHKLITVHVGTSNDLSKLFEYFS